MNCSNERSHDMIKMNLIDVLKNPPEMEQNCCICDRAHKVDCEEGFPCKMEGIDYDLWQRQVLAAVAEMLPKMITIEHQGAASSDYNNDSTIALKFTSDGFNAAIAEMRQRLIGGEK